MKKSIHLKYLPTNPLDKDFGLTTNSVGMQEIMPGEAYPPKLHPTRYQFNPKNGRILEEYQLLYLIKGQGTFQSSSQSPVKIKEGDAFLLFPGEWHSYMPDIETGWTEMWIGFNGANIEHLYKSGFISKDRPVYHVGSREDMINLYRQSIACADAQESGYQQMLCGLVSNLLCSCIYYDKNMEFRQDRTQDLISNIRNYIRENYQTVTPESAAEHIAVGYSKMRKLFKQYSGITLGKYIAEVKTNKAKDLLSNTDMSISEIAFALGFTNDEYFCTFFKRCTGKKPSDYRFITRHTG